MKYIKLERSDGGYAAWSPILPGCCDQGKTEEEALGNMKEAIRVHLSAIENLLLENVKSSSV
ncbi:type II toxin-antitoxin system HicB family antitoxin [Candidatus Acetothermia bacterium]|nr:type II toxin-antitoxin system HicB family antitoxin [Candidatus Acetothermia bacterium]